MLMVIIFCTAAGVAGMVWLGKLMVDREMEKE